MKTIILQCKLHGETEHYTIGNRCKKCNVIAVSRRRKELKIKAVEYLGGMCKKCNLVDSCPAIYDFHHLASSEKDFNISRKGYTYSWAKVKSELDKCILLCANCHRKEHFKEELFPIKSKNMNPNKCKCGKKITRKNKSCINCRSTKINWPSNTKLINMLEHSNFVQVGKILGVSDNAIRKRLKSKN